MKTSKAIGYLMLGIIFVGVYVFGVILIGVTQITLIILGIGALFLWVAVAFYLISPPNNDTKPPAQVLPTNIEQNAGSADFLKRVRS